ncbi:thioredoxin-like protein [Lentinula guzmanii]|uniref:Thioredoxin-like protein n=1 Tax=Lentinula guzmanii TaxID=2804957 RepID=A0AA38JWR4_9AGAR|nr:thioredoxin-like protein [Lentinula guzmanii]
MYADIEALVLSGELFNGPERSSSPTRSVSPSSDPGWHDEDLQNFDEGLKLPSDAGQDHQESIGMGPGRTGVKGVIRDRDEAEEINRQKRIHEMDDLRRKMEKGNLGGKTFLEEEREKVGDEKVDELVVKEREKENERKDVFGRPREGKFGHLREVDVHNYLSAVEKEERGIWVVVHLYEPSLDRCFLLDDTLAHLARVYPDTKFLRCRAAALGFATSSKPKPISKATRPSRTIRTDDDDLEDDRENHNDHEDEDEDPYEEDNVDLDMLPTMLVYRNGELVHNWVRVDWEAGDAGVEELLDKHHILPKTETFFGRFSVPSDGEDEDLIWSEEDS